MCRYGFLLCINKIKYCKYRVNIYTTTSKRFDAIQFFIVISLLCDTIKPNPAQSLHILHLACYLNTTGLLVVQFGIGARNNVSMCYSGKHFRCTLLQLITLTEPLCNNGRGYPCICKIHQCECQSLQSSLRFIINKQSIEAIGLQCTLKFVSLQKFLVENCHTFLWGFCTLNF